MKLKARDMMISTGKHLDNSSKHFFLSRGGDYSFGLAGCRKRGIKENIKGDKSVYNPTNSQYLFF